MLLSFLFPFSFYFFFLGCPDGLCAGEVLASGVRVPMGEREIEFARGRENPSTASLEGVKTQGRWKLSGVDVLEHATLDPRVPSTIPESSRERDKEQRQTQVWV